MGNNTHIRRIEASSETIKTNTDDIPQSDIDAFLFNYYKGLEEEIIDEPVANEDIDPNTITNPNHPGYKKEVKKPKKEELLDYEKKYVEVENSNFKVEIKRSH